MDIGFHKTNEIPVFEIPEGDGTLVHGELDHFIKYLLMKNNNEAVKVALDMSKKSFLNSTGLGELVAVKDHLLDRGIELVLINPAEKVESLINMVGLDEFFHIVPSEDEL